MGRTLSEAPLTTRNARMKLPAGLHWRSIDPDVHLGFRKGVRAGRWLVRWRAGKSYEQETLASADDALEADGIHTLSFPQAVSRARQFVENRRADARLEAAGPVVTVMSAIDDYINERESRVTAKGDARSRLHRHVMKSDIAKRGLHELTEEDLAGWRDGLPSSLASTTVRRLMNDLRAALNSAGRRHRARLPPHVPLVIKNGLSVNVRTSPVAREMQILSDAEVRRVVQAARDVDDAKRWDGDLIRLVTVLAATGARFSQIARMKVGDVQRDHGRLMVPSSHKGGSSKFSNRVGVPVGRDVLNALQPVVECRKSSEPLLERWRHKQTSPTQWTRASRGPWTSASELTRPWADITAGAEVPRTTIPYSLRHSSIVRGLRFGLPVRLVAALHDTSSAMIEAHYSAFIVSALDGMLAAAIIPIADDRI